MAALRNPPTNENAVAVCLDQPPRQRFSSTQCPPCEVGGYKGSRRIQREREIPAIRLHTGFSAHILIIHTVKNPVMKPRTQPLQSTRLMDQLRERIRYLHDSLSTEKLYVYWVRFFIRLHAAAPSAAPA